MSLRNTAIMAVVDVLHCNDGRGCGAPSCERRRIADAVGAVVRAERDSEILRLRAELEKEQDAGIFYREEISRLRAHRLKQHVALAPFAAAADNFDSQRGMSDPEQWYCYPGRSKPDGSQSGAISVADLRRARDAFDGKD